MRRRSHCVSTVDEGAIAFGRDITTQAVTFAKVLVPNANIAAGDLRSLDLPTATIDSILLFGLLEYIPPSDIPYMLSEFHRVLVPGGLLSVLVPSSLVPVTDKH
jgi:SAM-dependent methyltransferase